MIVLEKSKPKFNLTKQAPGLDEIRIGLSWDPSTSGGSPDADSSVFLLNENGKIPNEGFFVFYNNLKSSDGSVTHSGDNRTGDGEGDDEVIHLRLSAVSNEILQIMVVISIHNIEEGFHFGNVLNSTVNIYNQSNGSGLCQYKLQDSFHGCDSLIIGRFYRLGSEWEFEAMGQAFEGGLGAAVELYA
jgi:tellurium resistance protein TerD